MILMMIINIPKQPSRWEITLHPHRLQSHLRSFRIAIARRSAKGGGERSCTAAEIETTNRTETNNTITQTKLPMLIFIANCLFAFQVHFDGLFIAWWGLFFVHETRCSLSCKHWKSISLVGLQSAFRFGIEKVENVGRETSVGLCCCFVALAAILPLRFMSVAWSAFSHLVCLLLAHISPKGAYHHPSVKLCDFEASIPQVATQTSASTKFTFDCPLVVIFYPSLSFTS